MLNSISEILVFVWKSIAPFISNRPFEIYSIPLSNDRH